MITYEYRVHIAGDCVRVEAYDLVRNKLRPAFELELIEGLSVAEYFLMDDNLTTDQGPDNCIPLMIRMAMIAEMEEALFKLRRAVHRIRTP